MAFKLPSQFLRWFIPVAALAFLAFLAGGKSGLIALWLTHGETVRMEQEAAHLNAQIDSLNTVIDRLQHDTVYIERIAREKLGMARPTEQVFKFIDNPK